MALLLVPPHLQMERWMRYINRAGHLSRGLALERHSLLKIELNPNIIIGNGGPNSNLHNLSKVNFSNVTTRALQIVATSGAIYQNDVETDAAGDGLLLTDLGFNFPHGSAITVYFNGAAGVARTITIQNSSGTSGGATNGENNDDDSDSRNAPDGNNDTTEALVKWRDPLYWQGGIDNGW